jgi:hypothetical protein
MVTNIGASSPQGHKIVPLPRLVQVSLTSFGVLLFQYQYIFSSLFLSGPCNVGYMLVPLMVRPDTLAMWTNSEKHWLRSDHTLLEPIYVDQRRGGTSLVTYIGITGIPMTMVEYLTRVRWKGIHEERTSAQCTTRWLPSLARSRFRPFFASGFVIASLPSLGCQT